MTYPLDHGRGYAPLPRDVSAFEPLVRDHVAMACYVVILARAAHEPGWRRGSRGNVHLERGQALVGREEIGRSIGVSKTAAGKAIARLETLGLISANGDRIGTVVTVRSYGDFGEPVSSRCPQGVLKVSDECPQGDRKVTLRNGETGKREKRTTPLPPAPSLAAGRALPGTEAVQPEPMGSHEAAPPARGGDFLPGVDPGIGSAKKRPKAARSKPSPELAGRASGLAFALVSELNAALGTRHDQNAQYILDAARKLIRAGHTADEARLVVRAMVELWRDDPENSRWLQPSTLMRPSNFPRYLAEYVPRMGKPGRQTLGKTREPGTREEFAALPHIPGTNIVDLRSIKP